MQETKVATAGVIANPVSGKDIRRLVAHGSVFDNQEKVRIVRRMLIGMEAAGVGRVVYMPDEYGIVERALRGFATSMQVEAVPMRVENTQEDSRVAAKWMEAHGIGCIAVLGGDGTCRAVTRGTTSVPLVPLSTGTNNVFPNMMEATVAGLAAGVVAAAKIPAAEVCYRPNCLEIVRGAEVVDLALVDAAVYRGIFIGARAIWDMERVAEIFLARCRPETIGLSAIGGQLETIEAGDPRGLHLVVGEGPTKVTAAIAPGLFQRVPIRTWEIMPLGQVYPVRSTPCVLAFDGEREMEVRRGEGLGVRVSAAGPLVVDVAKAMARAQAAAVFVAQADSSTRAAGSDG